MGKRVNKLLNFVLEAVLSLISLLIFLTTILPVFSILFCTVYLWRCSLIGYVRIFRKNYARIMGGKNPVLAIDNIHTRPLNTIVGMGAFDGRLDLESASTFVQNIMDARESRGGKLLYPEMHQYYEEWNGFIWWKWVKDFSIHKHVTLWVPKRDDEVSEADLIQIIGLLEARPFRKKASPWEVVIVRNLRLNGVADEGSLKTAVVFR
jgi:hypothetical protein